MQIPTPDDTVRVLFESDERDAFDPEKTATEPRESAPEVTVLSPEDTLVAPTVKAPKPDAPPPKVLKRRASGPRKRVTLTTDAVRDAIEARYREEGQWEALVELYLNRLDVTENDAEKVELLKRVADVLAREMNDPGQAFDALLEALALAPKDDDTATALEEVARKLSKWPLLVEEMKGRLEAETDRELELRYAELLTRWYRIELQDPAGAEPYLARIKSIDPSHPLVHRRMASVYAEVGAWDAQQEALERALLSAKRDADRKGFHLALAGIHEQRSKQLDRAAHHYQGALAIDPACMEALHGVERLCRVREDFAGLAQVLERQAEHATSKEDRVRALVRLAELHEQRFVKPQHAAPRLEQVLELVGHDDPAGHAALEGLERCYHGMRAWDDLVRTLERRAAATKNVLERCDVLMRVAEVHESKRGDLEAAMDAYRRVYEADDGHKRALLELARLSEKLRDWTAAAAYRSRTADLVDDARARAQVHYQIGEMLLPDDRDPTSARLHYEKAVQLDPSHANAWEALRAMATRAGDGMHAVYCLERRAEHTESPRVKAQLLVELARMKTALGDVRGAFATYDWAIRTDPSNEAAARAVFDEYVRTERWAEASPVCDLLISVATREGDAARTFTLLRVATRIAVATFAHERALLAALAAEGMRPDDPEACEAVVAVCHLLAGDAPARSRAQPVLARVAASPAGLGADALVKLAEIQRADGDDAQAIETLCRALTLDAEHPRALEVLADVFGARGEWARAASCKQRLALAERDPAAQRARLLEVAELWEKRAKNPGQAAHLVEEALASHPNDLPLLHKRVALYKAMQAWDALALALRAVADAETDPVRRSKSLFAMAGVVREKIGNARSAALLYDEVLELDDRRLDAFEKIVRIWTELRDWNELRIAYSKMLGRVHASGDAALKHALYFQLGLVYRDRLGDAARALDAFRCAMQLRPDAAEDRRAVVELLVVIDQIDVAISTLREAIHKGPLAPDPYRELCELHLRARAHDKAWCAIDVLAHLGHATADELAFLDSYPPLELEDVPGTLAPGAWSSHILHPELDVRLSAILRIVTPAILRMRFASIPEAQREAWLGRRITGDESAAAKRATTLVRNAAEILGMPVPALYERPTMPMPFAVAPTPTPAVFVSLHAFEATPRDLLPFLAARRVGELRPDLAAHALFPTVGELKGLLKAAVRIAVATGTKNGMSSLKPDEQKLAKVMTTKELDALRAATSTVVGGAERVDIKRWLELADATLSRVGLLLAGDFDTAWRSMQREARAPGDLPQADWRSEMLSFAVSDEYADLRGAIGVGVEEDGARAPGGG